MNVFNKVAFSLEIHERNKILVRETHVRRAVAHGYANVAPKY